MMLADSSAWIWSRRRAYPDLRRWFDERLEAGEIATCDQVRLELLYGTRSAAEHERRRCELDALEGCPITPREWRRAIELQGELARLGTDHQKAAKPADLIIAAAAEAAGVELLHYDDDFELVQQITGQPLRRLAPRGTLC
jgi:predicted nucleic acid-binding protein